MNVRELKTGKIGAMRYGPAKSAVSAGTHEFVNFDESGEPKEAPKTVSKKTDKKTED